jgi:hypothetical protein
MDRRIDAHVARTQLGQIMDLAVKNNERFIVDRRGEPSVVIMSVQDFIRTAAPPPDWLLKAWAGAKRRGLETLTLDEINAEIGAEREEEKHTPAEAAARILELREGNILPEGETIKDLIGFGRA